MLSCNMLGVHVLVVIGMLLCNMLGVLTLVVVTGMSLGVVSCDVSGALVLVTSELLPWS